MFCRTALCEQMKASRVHNFMDVLQIGDVAGPACYQYGRLACRLIEGYARIDVHWQTEMTFRLRTL
jgi:hypothetical protein